MSRVSIPYIYLVLVIFFISGHLQAQDQLQQLNYLKTLSQISFKTGQWEQERDARIDAIVNAPKGEFETQAMYAKRLKDSQRLAQEIRDEYAGKISEAKRKFTARQKVIRDEIQALLIGSREDVTLTFALSAYNADRELFSITLTTGNESYPLAVPLSSARAFKQAAKRLAAHGNRQLTIAGNWEYFNWQVEFKGESYPFGPTQGAERMLATAAKHAIIPPDLKTQVAFSEPSGDDRLDAEETAELVVSIINKGRGPAYGVEIGCSLSGSRAVSYPQSVYVGEIPAGSRRSKRLTFKAGQNVASGLVRVTLHFTESNHFEPDDKIISFETEALVPPRLEIVDIGIDDASGNSRIEPREIVGITVRVQNLGQGSADDVKVKVEKESPDIYFFGESQESFALGSLAPGEYKDISFDMVSNKKAKAMPVSVQVSESRGRFGIDRHPLNLAFNQVQRGVEEMSIAGKYEQKKSYQASKGLSIDIEQDIPRARRKAKDDLAIIFGVEQYKNFSGVTFAQRDAAITKEYFVRALGIPENRIYFQTNDNVSKAEFDKVFSKGGWLDKRVRKQSNIFVFYAGHGAPDLSENKAYLIPYDGDPNYASQTGFSMDKMYQELERLQAKSVTVFLDACFSGANRESEMLLAGARPVFIEVKGPSSRGVTVFSASSSREISSAYPEKKHGLFTYFMLKGLQGAADKDGSRTITVGELGDYIHARVSETAGMLDREQTPEVQTIDRNEVIARY